LHWTYYTDDGLIYVGAIEWNRRPGFSMTDVFGVAHDSRTTAKAAYSRARRMTRAEAEAQRGTVNTWGRFETACDAGAYGPEW
jgi:hypothetical protein